MEEPSPRILMQVAASISERTAGLKRIAKDDPGQKDRRVVACANILNSTRGGVEKTILERIASVSPELSERIRESMFEFKDLVFLDKRAMQKVLAGLDSKVLAMALKSCPEDVRGALLSCVSQRTRDLIMEEKELLGSVALTEVLQSQKEIVDFVRKLIDGGEVQIARGREGAYVS
jgi:flagellar motor switch protein FliG